MGNINRIDLSKLKSHKSTFDSLEKSFNNSAYSTFNSSYIKRCSDPYVTKMKSNLTLLYNQIKKGYSNIDSWWTKYNQNAEGLEKKLSNEGNTITEYGIRAYATHLPELNDFKIPTTVSFASSGIVGALGGGLFANLGTVSANADPFAAIYSDYNIQNNIKEMVSDTNTKQDKEEAARMVGQGIAVSLTQALSPSLSSFLTTEQPKSILDHALDFLGDRAEDVGNFINDVGAQVSGAVTGIMDGVGSAVELIGEGILQLGNATLDVINRVAATASTFVTSAVKGFVNAAEGVFDFAVSVGSIAFTPLVAQLDLITFGQFNLTKQLHEGTQALISYDITESVASAIGNTEIGKAAGNWMKDKAILYDFFSTAGEVVGEVGFSLVSGGGWITAFMVGYGKGVESAYQNGASYGEGILSGGISGSLDAASYYLGGKIGGAYGKAAFAPIAGTGAKATIGNAGIRVGIDMLLGIGDSLLRPFSQFYQDGYTDPDGNYHSFEGMNVFEKYQVMFEQTGGLEGLAANATVGAAFSSLGEAFNLKKFFGRNVEKVSNKASNIKQNIKEKIADSQKLANGMTRKEMNNKLSRLKDLLELTESDYYKKIKNDPYSWGEARQEVYMVDREINTLEYELRDTNQLKMLLDNVEFDKKVKIENLKRNYEALKTYASLNPEDIPGKNIDYDEIARQMKKIEDTLGKDVPNTPFTPSEAFLKSVSSEYKRGRIINSLNDSLILRPDEVEEIADTISKRYSNARKNASNKYLNTFQSYRDHGELHVIEVAEYSRDLAKKNVNLNYRDIDEVYLAGLTHDLGMEDAIAIIDKKTGKIMPVTSSIDGGIVRKNHPLNSALTILSEGKKLFSNEKIDRDKIALLALTHSKSTSGIKNFADKAMWLNAIENLETASKQTGVSFDADRMRNLIVNKDTFRKLQEQAVCLRDGDAMSRVPVDSNGNQIMQTGESVIVKNQKMRTGYDDDIAINLNEEMRNVTDVTTNGIEITDDISKAYHIGEGNVRFQSDYTGEGRYVADIYLKDANNVPHASLMVIKERIGEVNTYGNIDNRIVKIHLPSDAINTKLSNFFKTSAYGNIEDVLLQVFCGNTKIN